MMVENVKLVIILTLENSHYASSRTCWHGGIEI